MVKTEDWRKAHVIRFFGLIAYTLFILFSFGAEDKLGHAIIQVILIIVTFWLIFVLPDKVMFKDKLVSTKQSRTKKENKR